MRPLILLAVLLFPQITPHTAREYYDEIYAAGGLDRFADEYVCFDEDKSNENFFIFILSKDLREGLLADPAAYQKLSKTVQQELEKNFILAHGYAKGIPFDAIEQYDADGKSWITDFRKRDPHNSVRMRLTVNWQTLRYKRAVEMFKDSEYQSELPRWGRCERVKQDIKQTANP